MARKQRELKDVTRMPARSKKTAIYMLKMQRDQWWHPAYTEEIPPRSAIVEDVARYALRSLGAQKAVYLVELAREQDTHWSPIWGTDFWADVAQALQASA